MSLDWNWKDDTRNPMPEHMRPDSNTEFIFTSMGEIEQWILPVIRMRAQKRISDNEMQFANVDKIDVYTDHVTRDLVFTLTARVANKDLGSFSYPEDWKQAFKERWFPKWLLKKYPVKYTTYTAKAFYPGIKIPEHQEYVQFYRKGEHY